MDHAPVRAVGRTASLLIAGLLATLAACDGRAGSSGAEGSPAPAEAIPEAVTPLLDPAFADSVDRLAAQRELLAIRGRHTYLPALLADRDGINHRWRERRGERMRVWVQDVDPAGAAIARRIIADAFVDWTESGIPVAFTVVPDSARAEVIVTWVERFDAGITGITRWTTDAEDWIVAATIELARHHPDGGVVDSSSLAAVARHEVGHLLGLDHVDDETSIMRARIRVSALSAADRRTIRLVYELPAGRLPLP